jgi:phosphatidylglycerol---prolipoprotein diacylglyceryl transferase
MFAEYYDVAGVAISSYYLFFFIALLASTAYFYRAAGRYGVTIPGLLCIIATVLLCAQLGAVVFAAVEATDLVIQTFLDSPNAKNASAFGSNFLGGLVGGSAGLYASIKLLQLSSRAILDAAAPALLLGVAIGRLGCFFSVDGCYGTPTELPWAMAFASGSHATFNTVHPTPIYESVFALASFVIVRMLLTRASKTSTATHFLPLLLSLFLYAVARFVVEFARRNPLYGGLSQAQWITLSIMICTLVVFAMDPIKLDRPRTRTLALLRSLAYRSSAEQALST